MDSADGTSDGKAVGRQRTTAEPFRPIALAPNSRRTTVVARGRHGGCRDHLQNRWSASLAMSTDGSFRWRPCHFLNRANWTGPDFRARLAVLDLAIALGTHR